MRFFRFVGFFGFLGLFLAASPASAQMYAAIGAAVGDSVSDMLRAKCIAGLAIPSNEEAHEADAPAQAVVAKYWALVSARDNVLVGDLFDRSSKSAWIDHGSDVRVHAAPITDRYARQDGNRLVQIPIAFVRSRDGISARGVWEVRNASGDLTGYYLVDFVRRVAWFPRRIELLASSAPAPTIAPYCETPGDIEAFHEAAKSIPESRIAKIISKSVAVATCLDGADCSEKWSRAKRWVQERGKFPLIRDTETLLLTSGPLVHDVDLAFVIVLDPPSADGRRPIRFRAWCGNIIRCGPSPEVANEAFLAGLQGSSPTTLRIIM